MKYQRCATKQFEDRFCSLTLNRPFFFIITKRKYLHYRSSGRPNIHVRLLIPEREWHMRFPLVMQPVCEGLAESPPLRPTAILWSGFPNPGSINLLRGEVEKLLSLSANHLLLSMHLVFKLLTIRLDCVRLYPFGVETKRAEFEPGLFSVLTLSCPTQLCWSGSWTAS